MNDSECVLWLAFLTLYWFNKDKPLPLHSCTHRFAESASLGCTDYWWEFHYPLCVCVCVCLCLCLCLCLCVCTCCLCICEQACKCQHVNCVWEFNCITGWVDYTLQNYNRGTLGWVIQYSKGFQAAPDAMESVWPCLTRQKTSNASPPFSLFVLHFHSLKFSFTKPCTIRALN